MRCTRKGVARNVKYDETMYERIAASMRERRWIFGDFITAAIAWSVPAFDSTPWKWDLIYESWVDRYPLSGEYIVKPFRLNTQFDEWVKKIVVTLDVDFNSLAVYSSIYYLPYFEAFPQSTHGIYHEWLIDRIHG